MTLDVSRVKALCFDVDGTLNDTDDLYTAKFARYFRLVRFLLKDQDYARAARAP